MSLLKSVLLNKKGNQITQVYPLSFEPVTPGIRAPILLRYHFALNLGGKKEKNVLKGGPGISARAISDRLSRYLEVKD